MSGEAMSEQGLERLLDRLQAVTDRHQHRQLLQALAAPQKTTVLSFFNQHAFNLAWSDADFRRSLAHSDVLLRDGVGIAALLKLLGRDPGLNMNGTDLIPQIVRAYKGRRVAVVGTATPHLEQAAQRLREMGAQVVFVQDGFADESRYLDKLVAAEPELVILGMGMPRQERLATALSSALRGPALVVNGGAILDFLAGRFPRAPQWLRRLRLEWLYRLLREPRRLWRRYIVGGAQFARRAWRMGWRSEAATRDVIELDGDLAAGAVATAAYGADHPRIVQLLQRVDAALPAQGGRIVQFLDVRPGDGASAIARGYAQACAHWRGRRVLWVSDAIDADAPWMGDPAWRQALSASPAPRRVTAARLQGAGGSAQAALGDRVLWQALSGLFDEIVVDAGGHLALLAAPIASGVVLVARANATPAAETRRRLDELAAVDAKVLGAVLDGQHSYLPRVLRERF